jgi:hypothetical protein
VRNLCVTISRFALAAWVGAAVLFIVTTLKEVRSPLLDSVTKANLAVMRFPVYYAFAFLLLGAGILSAAYGMREASKCKRWVALSLILFALLLTAIDYIWIYQPLAKMTAAVHEARPASFVNYHRASMWINIAQLGVSTVAAFVVCCPSRRQTESS